MNIDVILADDHPVVRDGIKAVIAAKGHGIKVIGEASNGEELLELAKSSPADVYIIDIAMPLLNGIEVTERLVKRYPKSKVIILTMHDNRVFAERAIECGAKGYLLKEDMAEIVVQAIRDVYDDKIFLSPKISKFIVQGFLGKRYNYTQSKKTIGLTVREKEVLQLIAEGFTTKEISERLKISLNTAHVHRNSILQKLDIHRQADLIRFAIKEGITSL